MAKYEAFHLRYDGGQRAVFGGTYGLVEHLEPFGSGLPTDAVWRHGGPLLVGAPNNTQQILAWIRGVPSQESMREGAWQAWGVVGPAGGFGAWMTFWDALSAAPERERLDALASALESGNEGPAFPPVPQRLATVLADLYTSEPPYRLVLRTPGELTLLPWCCLLGPVSPEDATIGPPRRMRLNLNVPMTYDVSITDTSLTDQQRTNVAGSPLLLDVVSRAQRGDVDAAIDVVWTLRNANAGERRKRVFALSPAPPVLPPGEPLSPRETVPTERTLVHASAADEEGPTENVKTFAERLQRWGSTWTPILVVLILLLQLAQLAPRAWPWIAGTSAGAGQTTTGAESIDTAGTTGTTATMATTATTSTTIEPQFTCSNWWTAPEPQRRVMARLAQRFQEKRYIARDAAAALIGGTWNEGVAVALSNQLQVNETQCAGVTLPLTGRLGEQTRTALGVAKCGSVKGDLAGALQWLCVWSGAQS